MQQAFAIIRAPFPATTVIVQASHLIKAHLQALLDAGRHGPILDLACGSGRNGIYLLGQGQPVVFADCEQAKLDAIAARLQGNKAATFQAVDFETAGRTPLTRHAFGGIVVVRYLHRPLMTAIKDAVRPGGLVVYETFTTDQPNFGRPTNPDFLLHPGELQETFHDWETLHSFEGVCRSETGNQEQAIAQIVSRKPAQAT